MNISYWNQRNFGLISLGNSDSLGVKADGTVIGLGVLSNIQNISNWTDITQVTLGFNHALGLRINGTVVATGSNSSGQGNVSGATDVVQMAAGFGFSFLVNKNGTVMTLGNYAQKSAIDNWTNITQVSTPQGQVGLVLGVKADGAAVGLNASGQMNLTGWTDIVQVAAGNGHGVGLRSDGTVVATGNNSSGQINTTQWTDIVQVAAGGDHTIGLRSDGTVVATGNNSSGQINTTQWADIVQVAASVNSTIGLKSDGTVVAAGANNSGQLNVGGWELSIGQFYEIEGITTVDGVPASMQVRAYEAQNGAIQIRGQSDANGKYKLRLPRWFNAYVMSVPPAGHRPQVHGPIIRPDELNITPAP